MFGNLVAEMTARRYAGQGDLCAAMRVVRWSQRPDLPDRGGQMRVRLVAVRRTCHVSSITRANSCCIAAVLLWPGSASRAARGARRPGRRIFGDDRCRVIRLTCVQICLGAGMVYTAAGGSCVGRRWSL
jgi:hypothetical protein